MTSGSYYVKWNSVAILLFLTRDNFSASIAINTANRISARSVSLGQVDDFQSWFKQLKDLARSTDHFIGSRNVKTNQTDRSRTPNGDSAQEGNGQGSRDGGRNINGGRGGRNSNAGRARGRGNGSTSNSTSRFVEPVTLPTSLELPVVYR
jgi:hypothetical protein